MEEFKIRCGETEAAISKIGGTVKRFSAKGRDILYPYQKDEKGKMRGGMPICAPWFGSSAMGDKHGLLRQLPMEVVSESDTALILKTFHCHAGMGGYPWHIEYVLTYEVREGFLSLAIGFKRKDAAPGYAPLNVGFHPYFMGNAAVCSVGDLDYAYDASFSDTAKMEPLKHDSFTVRMEDGEVDVRVDGIFRNESPQLYFWNDAPEKYVCVEPVLDESAWFNTDKGLYLVRDEAIDMKIELLVK